ncbi:MAG: MFS transporter [Bacillota bacterium]|nr:MFS transporter [Bacillota bacterium]
MEPGSSELTGRTGWVDAALAALQLGWVEAARSAALLAFLPFQAAHWVGVGAAGTIVSVAYLVDTAAKPVAGWWMRRHHRSILLAALLLLAAGSGLVATGRNLAMLGGGALLLGLGGAPVWPLALAQSGYAYQGQAGFGQGPTFTAWVAGSGIGYVSVLLLPHALARPLILALGLSAALLLPVTLRWAPRTACDEPENPPGGGGPRQEGVAAGLGSLPWAWVRPLLGPLVLMAGLAMVPGAFVPYLPRLLHILRPGARVALAAAAGSGLLLGFVGGGRISTSARPLLFLRASAALLALGFLLAAVSPTPAAWTPAAFAITAGYGAAVVTWNGWLTATMPAELGPAGLGLASSVEDAGFALGPGLAGLVLARAGFSGLLAMAAALGLLLFLLWFLPRPR